MEDEISDELHRIREEHAAQFNFDLRLILEYFIRSEAERDWPRVSFLPSRITELP